MVSKKNINYKAQQDAKRVPHYGIRKLSIGVASVLLGTVFYMQNVTAYADVNPTVNAGNDNVNVVNKDSGTSGSTGASSTSTGAGSASLMFSAGDTANSMVVRQASGSLVEGATKQVSNAAGQVNMGADKTNAPVSNRQTNAAGNSRSEPLSDNLSLSVNQNSNFNFSSLLASKVALTGASDNAVNGGFDKSTWGKLDVNAWQGHVQGDYYELTDYTGDANHVIVPNEADFEKAGISTAGKQVGVTSDLMHTIFRDKTTAQDATVAFSKTDNKMVKAIGSNWNNTWGHRYSNDSKAKLSRFDGTNLDISNVTDMGAMFNKNQISDLSSLSNWKVDNVTDMNFMFGYNQIDNLSPLSNWKVDNVKDMNLMFSGNQISDLRPLANWKVDNVKNMGFMFSNNHINDLRPLANWKVDNVTDMSYMFYTNQISDLSSLSNWKVDNVTDMSYMFYTNQISDLSSLSNWKVDNVTNMGTMFYNNHINDLSPLASWKVDSVTDMSLMFSDNQISDLRPLANWKVDKVTDMSFMFSNNQISNLSPLANWKVDKVTDMNWMFSNNQISDLSPLANWKVDKVTDMNWMFSNNQISDLSPLANWKVDNVTDMSHMFDNNSSTQTKNFQAKRVVNFIYPEGYTGKKQDSVTQTVDLPQKVSVTLTTKDSKPSNDILDWVTKKETPETPDPVYFQDYTVPEIKGLLEPDKTVITGQQADITKPINVTVTYKLVESNTNDAFALDSKNGLHEHANVNDNGGYDADFWGTLDVSKFTTVKNGDNLEITGYNGDAAKVIIPNIADFELNNLDQGAKQVTINSWVMRQLAKNATRIGLSKTNNQKVVASDAIWSDAFGGMTNNPQTGDNAKGGIWVYNPNLTVMDLHNLDTTNITDMDAMFNGGRNLKVVGDLSQWNTANVVNMHDMFQTASSLTNIGDLNNWDTSKVIKMDGMFSNATNLINIGDLSKWDTGNVTNMNRMFVNATGLTNIGNLDNWNTSKVTDMSWMFGTESGKQSHLTNIGDLSKWQTGNVTDMNRMFANATNLTNIGNLDNWNTSKVTDMSWMFGGTTNLTNIGDLSKWQTGNVTDMNSMFYNATNLTNIGNLDNWNTSKVTDMSWMFGGTTNLTNIGDLSKWQTGNVTNIAYMFASTNTLRRLNISNWNLTKLANKDAMTYMFASDTDLTIIANDLVLPVWYQNEINDADYFWNHHIAVITNVPELIRATGDIDNLKIDNQDVSRSIFYDSKGSSDAIQVLKDANQAYIKHYQSEYPGYTLNLAADVDQTDPIALANARFVSVPREVQFTIAYYDLTGKLVDSTTSMHKVGETVAVSPVAPANYVLLSGQSSTDRLMQWGLNEADFLVEPKVTTTTQTKTVSRTITVQTPDGQTNNVVQTVTFTRNSYLNQVTKQATYSSWSFNGQYQFSGYQPKPVDGYTADVAPAVSVTPDSSDTTLSLVYHKLAAVYSVDYQLANGKVVKDVSVTPERDGLIHLTAPQGYRLLTSVIDVKVGHSSQKLAVLVAPAEQIYTVHDDLPNTVTEPLIKTVTRTVKITMPNGHIRTVKQSVKFERTATVDSAGQVTYSNWQAIGQAQFNKVFVPKRRGYHLVITDASGKALTAVEKVNMVTATMNDAVVSVKYVKD